MSQRNNFLRKQELRLIQHRLINTLLAVSLLDKNQLVKDERPSSRNKKWFVDSTSIYFNGAPLGQLPYTGLVATEDCFLCTFDTVFAIGTDIEGVVASVKRL